MSAVTCAREDTFPCASPQFTFDCLHENIKILGALKVKYASTTIAHLREEEEEEERNGFVRLA